MLGILLTSLRFIISNPFPGVVGATSGFGLQ